MPVVLDANPELEASYPWPSLRPHRFRCQKNTGVADAAVGSHVDRTPRQMNWTAGWSLVPHSSIQYPRDPGSLDVYRMSRGVAAHSVVSGAMIAVRYRDSMSARPGRFLDDGISRWAYR
jgi:hypothetical protein